MHLPVWQHSLCGPGVVGLLVVLLCVGGAPWRGENKWTETGYGPWRAPSRWGRSARAGTPLAPVCVDKG